MAIEAFSYGTGLELTATFRNPRTKAVVDPANVRVRIVGPGGSPYHEYVYGIASEITKVSAGVFQTTVVCDKAGTWSYRFECWGSLRGGNDRKFAIRSSVFP